MEEEQLFERQTIFTLLQNFGEGFYKLHEFLFWKGEPIADLDKFCGMYDELLKTYNFYDLGEGE